MLRIGAIDNGECGRCIHWDDEHGCRIIDLVSITSVGTSVFCIDGETSEPDIHPVEFEVWE